MRSARKYVTLLLGVVLTLSLVLQPSFVFSVDVPMAKPSLPSTGATPTNPPISPKVITCPQSSPGCSVDKTITMTIGPNSIVFSSNPAEDVTITTPFQPANLQQKVKDHAQGLFAGYSLGFHDAMGGREKRPYPIPDLVLESSIDTGAWFDGYEGGYVDGYSAGKIARSTKLKQ